MRIALDYDKTYTADPKLWDTFIDIAKAGGHEVVLLTYRDDRYDWTDLMTYLEKVKDIRVYCTRGVAKGWYTIHFGPGPIDVWVDDNVKSITENSSFPPADLAEWRKEDSGKERPAL